MEPLCEFCGVVKSVVYCKSDFARLCLQCDGFVHSANSLSRRHQRSLLCDKCNSQPASVRCLDEKISVCQGCDCIGNGCSSLGHRIQVLDYYTGCPSSSEFMGIWSSVLELPVLGGYDPGSRPQLSLPLNEMSVTSCVDQRANEESFGLVANKLNELETLDPCSKLEPWMEHPPPMIPPNTSYISFDRDQASFPTEESNLPKVICEQGCSNVKDLVLCDDEDLCDGLNIDDVQLNLEHSDEIFGCLQGHASNAFEDTIERNLSFTESNIGPIENAIEPSSSSGQQDCCAFQPSHVAGSSNLMPAVNGGTNCFYMNPGCNRNINMGFPSGTGKVHPSVSLSMSNLSGESSVADYQDCELSPAFLSGESPWESTLEASSPHARYQAKLRYNEKKKTRTFGKQIRYASRKARADTRKRVKGRFVKAGEAFDYDPIPTSDF
ncbi:Zinc finger protein CONSTANS-LIKE 12 [Linum perenne]